MAQPIHCDGEDHRDALADVLVTHLATGDTSAWCFEHYLEGCQAVIDTVERAEREATDAAAMARLEQVQAGPGSTAEQDAATVAALAEGSADAAGPDDDEDDDADEDVEVGAVPAPDLAVSTFREAGDQSVQEGVGGPETGEPAPAGPAVTAEPVAAPKPPRATRERSRETSPPG